MTVFNAKRTRPALLLRTGGVGLAIGLVAASSAVSAGAPAAGGRFVPTFVAQVAPAASLDPAKQLPGTVAVSDIDFKRGDGGAGRLILRFSGEGATPDLRQQGSNIVISVANAELPDSLRQQLNVADFATPVQRIDARTSSAGAQLMLAVDGEYESMAYQTGREYIVEILPKARTAGRTNPAATGAAAAQANAAAAPGRPYSGKPVTFNFQDVPVRTVLQLVAEESGLNLVASDTVQGNVTLRLVNVPWDQALDIVLQAKGLDKRRSGNVVWVAPQPELAKYEQDREDARIALENRVDLVTEYVQINYHNATQIFKALTEAKGMGGGGGAGSPAGGSNLDNGFLSPRGRMVADERTNTLMISDIPKKITQMKELIRVIDRPVDQVIIEARVVVANETFARELGAKFGINGATGSPGDRSSLGFGGTAAASSANALARQEGVLTGERQELARDLITNLGVTNAAGALGLSILNAGYLLDLELSAMQTEGRGEVVSNPRVVTSNQREAVISQGQEVGYVTVQPAAVGGVATPSVQFKEVLLQLRVTPTITGDGRVFLNMNIKKDEVEGFVDTSIGDVPIIGKSEVNTAVLIEDGQTVVVGGVYEFNSREDVSKVPFLADIPFLGVLFKNKSKIKQKAELLIMVTPKVLHVAQRN
ncbi:type IV pilus secretin PilQ [Lysobacter korlensis]|uniref:Type IV pilus secretin PilQ n=1 Tax=Lysobacter korlensis TaxID=553636 RepID=A0ABV6RJ40_9GAMM